MENSRLLEFLDEYRDEISTTSSHKKFLNHEFLTWLWFYAETLEGAIELKIDGHKDLMRGSLSIEDKVALTAKVGMSYDHIIKGGSPGTCQEAALALRLGKIVKEMRLSADFGDDGVFSFTLNAEDLCPRSVRLPELRDDRSETPLEQRLLAVKVLARTVESLMKKFMSERAGKVWENTRLDEIRTWIKTRAQGRDGVIH